MGSASLEFQRLERELSIIRFARIRNVVAGRLIRKFSGRYNAGVNILVKYFEL